MKSVHAHSISRRLLLVAVFAGCSSLLSAQQQPTDFFRQNCASCHTIGGGRLTGPDLKNVEQNKDRAWLVQWLQNPKAVIDAGDPYAEKLLQESRGVVMPTINGMSPAMANALLDPIAAESKLAKSHFAGSQISPARRGSAVLGGSQAPCDGPAAGTRDHSDPQHALRP